MAKKKYDVVAKVGEYQKGGETKARYVNVGAIIMGDKGPYMVINRSFNPAGIPNPENRDTAILSLFEPKDQQQQQPQGQDYQAYQSAPNDDVPF